MSEETNYNKLETGIDARVAKQYRAAIIELLIQKSDQLTLGDLTQLTESSKYGKVSTEIVLQELLDAYAESEKLTPEVEVAPAELPGGPKKRQKKAARQLGHFFPPSERVG